MGRLVFQVAFLRVSGRPPTWLGDGSRRAGCTRKFLDTQLRYLLVTLTSEPALQIIRQKPSGVHAFRDLARRYNPRSQARSLAQLQEIMHFDFGQEPAGVTDRMIVFERLVGEYETSSGEALGVQVKCAVLLERVPPELRTHLLLTCGSRPDYAIMRQTV